MCGTLTTSMIKRLLRVSLLALNASAFGWALLVMISGNLTWTVHLSMIAVFSMTGVYLAPHNKTLWDKIGRIEYATMAVLWLLTFALWGLGVVGVEFATVDRFFAAGYLTASFSAAVLLWRVTGTRSWQKS